MNATTLPIAAAQHDPRLLEAFELMWGTFPAPMMLVHRTRHILAVNDAAQAQGINPGVRCFSLNPVPGDVENEACKACRANEAMKTCTGIATDGEYGGVTIRGYWLPLKGAPDYYIHGYSQIPGAAPAAP